MIAMPMGNDSLVNRLPWIDVKISCGAEQAFISEVDEQCYLFDAASVHCNFRSIHLLDEIDLLVLKVIERGCFAVDYGLDVELCENKMPFV